MWENSWKMFGYLRLGSLLEFYGGCPHITLKRVVEIGLASPGMNAKPVPSMNHYICTSHGGALVELHKSILVRRGS